MKARIKITLKNGVLDPQGKAIEGARRALGFSGVGDVRQGKYIELDLAETDEAKARAQRRAHVQGAARQHRDRELFATRSGNCDAPLVRHRFPRLQLRPRRQNRDRAGDGAPEDGLARRRRRAGVRRDRAAGRVLLRRLSALRRDGRALADHEGRDRQGQSGHAGHRHLQRLPDPVRVRPAAWSADAQRFAAFRLPRRVP